MDWNAAIERNRDALKRVLAALVAMAGLAGAGPGFPSPLWGGVRGGGTLPRHLHRAALRLLRPAEAAARRLVIVAARGLVLSRPAPPRPRKPKPKQTILRNGVGTGILLPPDLLPQAGLRPPAARTLSLPLTDPLSRPPRQSRPAASGVPRISFPGFSRPSPAPSRRPPSPHDPIDATRLALRLAALASALDDLPREARRFARWRRRRDAGLVRRLWPLRPGRPPGWRRKPAHEVHEVLNEVHGLAFWALERPDTS